MITCLCSYNLNEELTYRLFLSRRVNKVIVKYSIILTFIKYLINY